MPLGPNETPHPPRAPPTPLPVAVQVRLMLEVRPSEETKLERLATGPSAGPAELFQKTPLVEGDNSPPTEAVVASPPMSTR